MPVICVKLIEEEMERLKKESKKRTNTNCITQLHFRQRICSRDTDVFERLAKDNNLQLADSDMIQVAKERADK